MRKTLKQIDKALEQFATAYKLIKSYRSEGYDEQAGGGFTYPMMWANIPDARPTIRAGEIIIPIDIYMLDKPASKNDNIVPVLSEQLLTSSDLYTYFNDNELEFGFFCEDTAQLTPIRFDFVDKPIGYKMTLTFKVAYERNENIIAL